MLITTKLQFPAKKVLTECYDYAKHPGKVFSEEERTAKIGLMKKDAIKGEQK